MVVTPSRRKEATCPGSIVDGSCTSSRSIRPPTALCTTSCPKEGSADPSQEDCGRCSPQARMRSLGSSTLQEPAGGKEKLDGIFLLQIVVPPGNETRQGVQSGGRNVLATFHEQQRPRSLRKINLLRETSQKSPLRWIDDALTGGRSQCVTDVDQRFGQRSKVLGREDQCHFIIRDQTATLVHLENGAYTNHSKTHQFRCAQRTQAGRAHYRYTGTNRLQDLEWRGRKVRQKHSINDANERRPFLGCSPHIASFYGGTIVCLQQLARLSQRETRAEKYNRVFHPKARFSTRRCAGPEHACARQCQVRRESGRRFARDRSTEPRVRAAPREPPGSRVLIESDPRLLLDEVPSPRGGSSCSEYRPSHRQSPAC